MKASEDLELEGDLRLEAARMLGDARADFVSILVSDRVRQSLPAGFVELVSSDEDYA